MVTRVPAGAGRWTAAAAPPADRLPASAARTAGTPARRGTAAARGAAAEDAALALLAAQGLVLVERNYRVARGPHARGGEIDLVMRDRDGTLVFVEVRARSSMAQGGAAASIGATKQQRLRRAAEHYLLRWPALPRCRFDVVTFDGGAAQWLRAAF